VKGGIMLSRCENCKLREFSEKKPDSLVAKIWRWHTKWCPGWKAYQKRVGQVRDMGNK
jgi:hypothetical protein